VALFLPKKLEKMATSSQNTAIRGLIFNKTPSFCQKVAKLAEISNRSFAPCVFVVQENDGEDGGSRKPDGPGLPQHPARSLLQ
jgi:hypothetical protein